MCKYCGKSGQCGANCPTQAPDRKGAMAEYDAGREDWNDGFPPEKPASAYYQLGYEEHFRETVPNDQEVGRFASEGGAAA